MKFRPYVLVKLNKAVNETTGGESHSYNVTIIDVLGRKSTKELKTHEINRDFSSELRMNKNRAGQMISGEFHAISNDDFERLKLAS